VNDVGELIKWAVAFVVPGGVVAGYLAIRKDRRDEPADKADTLQKLMDLSTSAAAKAAEAAIAASDAQVSAAKAVSDVAVARAETATAVAETAQVKAQLEEVRSDSLKQDIAIDEMDVRILRLTRKLHEWWEWGRHLHVNWDVVRTQPNPPPLPATSMEED